MARGGGGRRRRGNWAVETRRGDEGRVGPGWAGGGAALRHGGDVCLEIILNYHNIHMILSQPLIFVLLVSILPGVCIFWCHTSQFCWCGTVCWCGFRQKTPAKHNSHQQNKGNTSRYITPELMNSKIWESNLHGTPAFIGCAPWRHGKG
jgi:hypothetical protein